MAARAGMISSAFAAALAAGRNAFNQRVRDARRRYPAFRTDVLQRFLSDEVDGVVGAVDPARAGAVAHAAVDVTAGREVGGFTGFGGAFAEPPEVRAGADGFVVRAGERCHLLLADAYGAVLLAATPDEFDRAAPGGAVQVDARRIAPDLPADGLAVCASGPTLALTSPYTHAIRVLPRGPR
ncbi:hypothetical protein ACCD08_22770 [Telluria sp. Tellsp104]